MENSSSASESAQTHEANVADKLNDLPPTFEELTRHEVDPAHSVGPDYQDPPTEELARRTSKDDMSGNQVNALVSNQMQESVSNTNDEKLLVLHELGNTSALQDSAPVGLVHLSICKADEISNAGPTSGFGTDPSSSPVSPGSLISPGGANLMNKADEVSTAGAVSGVDTDPSSSPVSPRSANLYDQALEDIRLLRSELLVNGPTSFDVMVSQESTPVSSVHLSADKANENGNGGATSGFDTDPSTSLASPGDANLYDQATDDIGSVKSELQANGVTRIEEGNQETDLCPNSSDRSSALENVKVPEPPGDGDKSGELSCGVTDGVETKFSGGLGAGSSYYVTVVAKGDNDTMSPSNMVGSCVLDCDIGLDSKDKELFASPEHNQVFESSVAEWTSEVTVARNSTLLINNLEGWHRFDLEEGSQDAYHTDNWVASQSSYHLAPWEQLLEEDGAATRGHSMNLPPQVERIDSSFQVHQLGIASPGNPFIEDLDRVSNFSEAESSHPLLRTQFAENNHADMLQNATELSIPVEGEEVLNPCYSADDTVGFVAETKELFEAPSFMSLVDPESNALFKASMPVYQSSSTSVDYGTGEKWEANFDLVFPSSQGITRTSSLCRTDIAGGQSYDSSFSQRGLDSPDAVQKKGTWSAAASPKSRPSALLSPKLSPMVKKVADKVRSTPTEMLNTVRKVVNPKVNSARSVNLRAKQKKSMCGCFRCFI